MLTEHFIAAVGTPAKPPGTGVAKDAAIFLHEYQPLAQQRAVFKKSATPANCLAVSESHIFAAQADKGVVHVYSRERGNQEATVPFTEKITSITLACEDAVLVLGTQEGRIFLWETCSGRQVTTSQAHLQSVVALVVDVTSNFLFSASTDSTVHVWSIPGLLSFSNAAGATPLRTFSAHHSEITALVLGHSTSHCNFAVSASTDKTCLVWDYHTNNVLRTYLLPAIPLSLALDAADRAVYVGYEDGSVQQLDLFASPSGSLEAIQTGEDVAEPVQPPTLSRWKVPDATHGAALSLSLCFDSSVVISGHQSGSVLSWDVARGSFIASQTQTPLPGPVNNLTFLPATGFQGDRKQKLTEISEIVKPKFAAFDISDGGDVPANYTLNVQFPEHIHSSSQTSIFHTALTAPTIPAVLLDEGLSELAAWGSVSQVHSKDNNKAVDEDYMALDDGQSTSGKPSVQEENTNLKLQLEALRRVQKRSFEKIEKLNEEKKVLASRSESKTNGAVRNGLDGDVSSDDDAN